MVRLSRRALLGATAALAFTAALPSAVNAQGTPLRVGVTAGPHAQILEVVARVAARDGLQIKAVEFSDYIQPNAALSTGDLDANSYQHQPFLDQQVKDRGYKIVSVAKTVIFPMGIYSQKVKSIAELPQGGRIGIPNDPTNGGRALAVLAQAGAFQLREGLDFRATVADIVQNPKRLRVVEIDAAQIPRALPDLDAAAINTNYALPAGLNPVRDAIAVESRESPYANLIAVREQDRARPEIAKLVKAYHSDEVKRFIEETFQGSVVPAW